MLRNGLKKIYFKVRLFFRNIQLLLVGICLKPLTPWTIFSVKKSNNDVFDRSKFDIFVV
jgi:hypothetical protein